MIAIFCVGFVSEDVVLKSDNGKNHTDCLYFFNLKIKNRRKPFISGRVYSKYSMIKKQRKAQGSFGKLKKQTNFN